MPASRKLAVVLCWHMHQPEYRNLRDGRYCLPWTYLHVIKDYVDMVAHLEANPRAKAVVNFAPVLLEQIEDYADQVNRYLREGAPLRDELLAALIEPALPEQAEQRMGLIRACLNANRQRMIQRYGVSSRLAEMADWLASHPEGVAYVSNQYLADLLVWYHLWWMGETVKRNEVRIQRLIDKGQHFNFTDRRALLEVIGELLSSVILRYRTLVRTGQVELSVTPYAHPIMPLMVDIESARDAWQDCPLPQHTMYPGGIDRVRWHLRQGIESFRRAFGFLPQGCWPSEGGLSADTLRLLDEFNFRWTATGENVLCNSLGRSRMDQGDHCLQAGYRYQDTRVTCFFRDDGLSDLIGFRYSDWHADDAVADLLNHLVHMADTCDTGAAPIVSIIMDGENAWEYYPENGYYFLNTLYERLSDHPRLELTTYCDYLAEHPPTVELNEFVAGSWVYGTFSTWIGDQAKNRGWDMLVEAKQTFDRAVSTGRLSASRARKVERQLAICEGSDWFWWFGDYNPAMAVSSFEQLFRMNLANLYGLLGELPPAYLGEAFTHGSGAPAKGGAMRPGSESFD